MSSTVTFGRLIGLIVVVAGLGSGIATAGNTPQGLRADGLRLQAMAKASKQMQDCVETSYTPRARTYGVDEATWRRLPREDQEAIRKIAAGETVPSWTIVDDHVVEVAGR